MRITPYGAAGEVTGSCYLLETSRARVLIDFGMHQGDPDSDERNEHFPPFDAPRLDAVVITHAHIDHIGRLPTLPKHGYRGPIYMTPATAELAVVLLRDSAHLQEMDADRTNLRLARDGKPLIEPLYTVDDIDPLLPQFKTFEYDIPKEVAPGVTIRYADAGHIIGSASVEVTVNDDGGTRTLVFSGDIGHSPTPFLREPALFHKADLVVMESTYGDRDHKDMKATIDEFNAIVHDAVWAKEKVLIPAFAVGRTETIIYYLATLVCKGTLPQFPIFLDSPMAIEAFEIYKRHSDLFDQEAKKMAAEGCPPLDIPGLQFSRTGEDSRKINTVQGAAVIIAASGMLNGGRILHHLKYHLWQRGAHLMIVGYQPTGSLGCRLIDGAQTVRIMGEDVPVRAKIHSLGGFSAHAGQSELVKWAAAFKGGGPGGAWPKYVLTHGDDAPREALAQRLERDLGLKTLRPKFAEAITL